MEEAEPDCPRRFEAVGAIGLDDCGELAVLLPLN
jgi:hypothetical protein